MVKMSFIELPLAITSDQIHHWLSLNPSTYRHLLPYFHLRHNQSKKNRHKNLRHTNSNIFVAILLFIFIIAALCAPNGAYLIFANRQEIRKVDLSHIQQSKGPNSSVIIDRLEDAVAIDFDYESRIIFWSDIGFEAIQGLRLSDSYQFNVIVAGIVSPDDLACDWVTKKIYWVDSETNRIEVAHYNGSSRRVLFWENLDQPRAIVVAPVDGIMFWSDWGANAKIEKASMDGNDSTREVIVQKDISWPNGLAVDHPAKRLYWTDAQLGQVSSIDFAGENRRDVSCGPMQHPFALTLFDSLLFWTDWKEKGVYYCNMSSSVVTKKTLVSMNSGGPSITAGGSSEQRTPMGISVFDASRQPKLDSPCLTANGNCSHLCLLSSTSDAHFSCACPTGIKLLEDGRTCHAGPEKMLLVARRNDIRRISLDTKDYTAVVLPIRPIKHATVIDYDPVEGKVYWCDDEQRVIQRSLLNGSEYETIVSSEVHHPDGIAIDWVARNIYWTDAGTDRIEVARLNGSSRTILLNDGLDQPRAIVVHPNEGLMFWSDWGEAAKIERAALDGTNRAVIVNTSIIWPNGLAIDYELSFIYWCDAKLDTIEMARFDGSARKQIWRWRDEDTHLFGFALFDEWVYWTDWQHRSIERVHKLTGQGRETITEQLADLMGIKAVWSGSAGDPAGTRRLSVGTNACATDNGNCSHLCLNRPHQRYVCACPTGYELSAADQRTCSIPEASFLLLRKSDIRRVPIGSEKFDVVPISGLQSATAFDVHIAANQIYWIDSKHNIISRSLANGSNTEIVVQLGLESLQSLAIDWIARNLYWSDTRLRKIEVSRADGSFRRILYHDPKRSPHSLALDPIAGYLFWTDWSGSGRIERSLLDGDERETVIDSTGHATSLTLDRAAKRVYWITASNAIMSCHYNGSFRVTLQREGKDRLQSLAIFNESLYFVNHDGRTIEAINRNESSEIGAANYRQTMIKRNDAISSTTDLFMYNSVSQTGWNFCAVNNGGCSHLCFAQPPPKSKSNSVLATANNIFCSCAAHYKLYEERQCLPPESFLLFSHKNGISRFLFDPEEELNSFQDVTLLAPNTKHIKAMAYDQYDHSIYWIDGKNQAIRRSHINGSGYETIMQSSYSDIVDLVIDPYSRFLFWTSNRTNSINGTRLISKPVDMGSFHHSKYDYPRLLAYHHHQNFLFWTNEQSVRQIERISLPDVTRVTVISGISTEIVAIAVDQEMDFLLWTCRSCNKIEYSDLNGKRGSELYHEANFHPIALATYSRYLFWIERERKSIEKLPLDLNMGKNKQTIFGKIPSIADLISVPAMKRNASSLRCVINLENNGCSHLCTILHGSSNSSEQAKCGCPRGLVLDADGKYCKEPVKCAPGKFACGNGIGCVDSIFRCNGSPDCSDNSDELNCPKCGPNQSTCIKNSLSHEELICLDNVRVCDNVKDCFDGHDEACCADRFRCNSRHCLTSNQLCDGKTDCLDGEDEEPRICQHYSQKTASEGKSSYRMLIVLLLIIVFMAFLFFQCKRCFQSKKGKTIPDILMTEQRSGNAASDRHNHRSGGGSGGGSAQYHRSHASHRIIGNHCGKKATTASGTAAGAAIPLLNKTAGHNHFNAGGGNKMDHCNTMTSTTTISGTGLDTLPTDQQQRHIYANNTNTNGNSSISADVAASNQRLHNTGGATNIASSSQSGSSTAPVSYPFETVNPPPSPATERSQSVYSSYSSSLFVPRASANANATSRGNRAKNGGMFGIGKSNSNNRRHKKSRWSKSGAAGTSGGGGGNGVISLRGPPPTPCGTDVYDELGEPSSVKYVFYDNAQSDDDVDNAADNVAGEDEDERAHRHHHHHRHRRHNNNNNNNNNNNRDLEHEHEDDDEFSYKPPPPTPRHYFSDPSCPPSPVTEHSFCNINLNPPPPPSPVQQEYY